MLTLFGIICVFVLIVGVLMILTGIISIGTTVLSPIIGILVFIALDVIVIKALFGTKKKSKKEE
jgi:predicted tellurium resistance membrane protein TerC